jgi:hypothetical protein
MPQPHFPNTQSDDVPTLRKDVLRLSQQLGPSSGSVDLGEQDIAVAETRVPHGQNYKPRWRAYDLKEPAIVYQTKEADERFLYLAATTATKVGIEVW